jgi:hypothetical protein
MGYYKEMLIEKEDAISYELDRLQKSFFESSAPTEFSILDFPIVEEDSFEPDRYTLPLPQFDHELCAG